MKFSSCFIQLRSWVSRLNSCPFRFRLDGVDWFRFRLDGVDWSTAFDKNHRLTWISYFGWNRTSKASPDQPKNSTYSSDVPAQYIWYLLLDCIITGCTIIPSGVLSSDHPPLRLVRGVHGRWRKYSSQMNKNRKTAVISIFRFLFPMPIESDDRIGRSNRTIESDYWIRRIGCDAQQTTLNEQKRKRHHIYSKLKVTCRPESLSTHLDCYEERLYAVTVASRTMACVPLHCLLCLHYHVVSLCRTFVTTELVSL